MCHDVDMAEQSAHNDHYLVEDTSVNECKIYLNSALNMLGLFISNVTGHGYFQMLAACKTHFGPDRHYERDKSRDMIKLKSSIINKCHKTCTYDVIVERFRHWGKFLIEQFLP